MPHDQKARVQAHKSGRRLAHTGESRATVNDVARTLPVDEADALLAGSIDPKIRELAENFLAGVPGVKPEDTTELAESIQHLCENFRRILVNAAHEAEIR